MEDKLLNYDDAVALLLQTVPAITPVSVPIVSEQKGGLFNHVLKVYCVGDTWFVKQYLDKNVSNVFAPPPSPKADRAELAHQVQAMAHRYTPELVPQVWLDAASCTLIVAGVAEAKELIHYFAGGDLQKRALNQIAQVLAHLHQQTFNRPICAEPLYRNEAFRDYKLSLQYDHLAGQLDKTTATAIRKLAAEYRQQQFCVLHGDPNSRNVVVNQGTGVVGVIDFEQSHVGNPVYDLAYILSEVCISGLFYGCPDLAEVVTAFLDAYLHVFQAAQDIPGFYSDLAQHLGVQIIYRFLGPSRAAWTFYIPGSLQREAMIRAASALCLGHGNSPKPGLAESISLLQSGYQP